MRTTDSHIPEDHEAALLAAYDEALAAGLPPALDEQALAALAPEAAERLRKELASLEFLDGLRPRRRAGQADGAAPAAPVLGIPAEFGRFRVLCELGRGGHGVVLLASDPVLNRQVALKVPRPEMLLTREMRERFLHEAQAAAGLDHPGIVPVYEAGEADLVCYIVSAYCPGSTFSEWLQEQRAPVAARTAAELAAHLAEAVAYTHAHGVLHRDLKPANVLLAPRTEGEKDQASADLPFVPKLTDFGLAKTLEASLAQTRSSVILGTPLYMAPEQAEGRAAEVGPATDVYGLGVILYEVLTGRTPFTGTTVATVLDQIRTQEPPPLRRLRPDVTAELAVICHKCLQKEPAQRYASAAELAADLRAWLRGEAIAGRLPGPLARLNAWSLRRERIRDAGLLAIAVNAAMIVYSLSVLSFMLFFGIGSQVPDVSVAALEILASDVVFHVPFIWIGLRTLAGRLWALWTGLGMSAFLLTGTVCLLLLPTQDWGGFHRDFAEKWNLFSLLIVLFAVLPFAYGLAIRAYYRLPREQDGTRP